MLCIINYLFLIDSASQVLSYVAPAGCIILVIPSILIGAGARVADWSKSAITNNIKRIIVEATTTSVVTTTAVTTSAVTTVSTLMQNDVITNTTTIAGTTLAPLAAALNGSSEFTNEEIRLTNKNPLFKNKILSKNIQPNIHLVRIEILFDASYILYEFN